jgi:hypothetical protein
MNGRPSPRSSPRSSSYRDPLMPAIRKQVDDEIKFIRKRDRRRRLQSGGGRVRTGPSFPCVTTSDGPLFPPPDRCRANRCRGNTGISRRILLEVATSSIRRALCAADRECLAVLQRDFALLNVGEADLNFGRHAVSTAPSRSTPSRLATTSRTSQARSSASSSRTAARRCFPLFSVVRGFYLGFPSNSSPIHFWNALISWALPRKFLTMSLADSVPPGSSTVRR